MLDNSATAEHATETNASGYKGEVGPLYLAMIPPETAHGYCLANPTMDKAVRELPAGSSILELPCGSGHTTIAAINASQTLGKDFEIAIGDACPDMLKTANLNIQSHFSGAVTLENRVSTLDQLTEQADWQEKFDLVLMPNVVSELFGNMKPEDYENHVIQSLNGVRSVLKPGGKVLIDIRDWEESFRIKFDETYRINVHDGIEYRANYIWEWGESVEDEHIARTTFSNDQKTATNTIRFCGQHQIESVYRKVAGLPIEGDPIRELRGPCNEPFLTHTLEKAYG